MSDSASSQVQGGAGAGRGRFRYLRWVAVGVTGTALVVALAAALLPVGDLLHRENGVLEDLSLLCWILSGLIAFWTAGRAGGRDGRLAAAWTGWMAVLAALRELDVHILLNPRHLGAWGVRYRLDWWFDGSVSVWLRLGWGLVFLTALVLAVYPPLRLRPRLIQLFRKGDALTGLLVVSVGFLVLGFVIDDILRPIRFVSRDTKQLIEETSETIGAVLYCASMLLQWRRSLSLRLCDQGLNTAA